jgi:hypothetical protein
MVTEMDDADRPVEAANPGDAERLTVTVHGPATAGGSVDAAVYARFLADFLVSVRRVEVLVRREGQDPVRFEIAEMHTSAPCLTISPVALLPEHGTRVVSAYMQTVEDLEERGTHPPYINAAALQSFRKLACYVGDGLGGIAVAGRSTRVNVTRRLERAVNRLLGMVLKTRGSFSGRLEYINAHRGCKCRIYPRSGPSYVECRFGPELLPQMAAGLKRSVTVSGTLYYLGFQAFPYRIDAEEVVVHPPERELPTIWELWGLAPDVTEGERVEDYVRGLRGVDA